MEGSSVVRFALALSLLAAWVEAKAVLMVVTSHDKLGDTDQQTGWYLPEAAHPYWVFKKAGVDMTWASPKGGEAPVDKGSVAAYKKDPESMKFLNEVDVWKNTVALSDLKADDFDALFVVGGYGVMWDLVGNEDLQNLAKGIYEKGGIVSGVCHGPAALVGVKLSDGTPLFKGKKVACFTNEEEDVLKRRKIVPMTCQDAYKAVGAKYSKGKAWTDHEAVDGTLITGQNPQSAKSTAKAVVQALGVESRLFSLPSKILQNQGSMMAVALAFSGALTLVVLAKTWLTKKSRRGQDGIQDEELLEQENEEGLE